MDLHDQLDPSDTPEVQLQPDEITHIRGVQTAPKEEGHEPERPLADVIPIRRVETLAKVSRALFDKSELEKYRKPGEREKGIRTLFDKLNINLGGFRGETVAQKYAWASGYIGAMLKKIQVANDVVDDSEYPNLQMSVESFFVNSPVGTREFEDDFRDLNKLYFLLKASENVALRNGL